MSSLEVGGNQSNLVNAGAPHDVNGPGNIGKAHVIITLNESDLLGAFLENVVEAGTQRVPVRVLVVDLQLPRIKDLHHNRFLFDLLLFLLIGRRGLWHQCIQTLSGSLA